MGSERGWAQKAVGGFWRGEERKVDTDWRFRMSNSGKSRLDLFLKEGVEFDRIKRHGRRIQTPMFNLVFLERPDTSSRMGIVVGRHFGKAVNRNRAKRVFRELARTTRMEFVSGKEFLIFPKKKVLQSRHCTIREVWRTALADAGLIEPCFG